jgi:hypothetical protein
VSVTTDTRTNPEWTLDYDTAFTGPLPKPKPVVTVGVAGTPLDPCALFLPMTITHGRSGLDAQPDAPSLEVVVAGRVTWQRGDPMAVAVDGVARFSGFIDTMQTTLAGGQFATKVTAVGWLAKAGAVKPSTPPRPAEDDVARASAYLAAFRDSFGPWDYRIQGAKTATLIPRDVDGGHTVLDLVHEVCASTGALLWQARDGALVYGTASHRTANKSALFIGDCDLLDGIEWVKGSGTLVNRVRVQWGTADPKAVHEDSDAASLAAEGPREVSVDSLLADQTDATLLANLILFRRARPYWNLPGGAMVRTKDMDPDEYRALLALDVSDLVTLSIPRSPGYPSNVVEWAVEGWVETWDAEGGEVVHTMQMALSDRQRFGLTGIRTVGELAAGFTVATAGAMTARDAMFKELRAK